MTRKLDGNYVTSNTITDAQISSAVSSRANNAANTVRVSQNNGSTLSAKQLNFVNTGTVTITVTDSGNGNANIAFASSGVAAGYRQTFLMGGL